MLWFLSQEAPLPRLSLGTTLPHFRRLPGAHSENPTSALMALWPCPSQSEGSEKTELAQDSTQYRILEGGVKVQREMRGLDGFP